MGKVQTVVIIVVAQKVVCRLGAFMMCLLMLTAQDRVPPSQSQTDLSQFSPYRIASSEPNAPISDPNRPNSEDNRPGSDSETHPFESSEQSSESNAPASEPNKEVASDPNITAADPNMPAVEPNTPVFEPNTYYLEQFIDAGPTEDTTGRIVELVGFIVRGRRAYERLAIDDLDSIVTSDGQRLLPLLRVLRAFSVSIDDQGTMISFTPEGVGVMKIDFEKRQIQIKGTTRPLDYLEATSEITLRPDIYIAPEDLSEILDIELEWDNELYEYRIQLDRTLSIWKREHVSLFGIRTQRILEGLPEALPAADSSEDLLQFIELNLPSTYKWSSTPGSKDSHSAGFSSPGETFWGNFQKGQYKVRISNAGLLWQNNERGWHWRDDDSYIAKLDQLEWVYRLPSSEVALGDSAFGLGELVFPGSRMTGIRINGLNGFDGKELEADRSSLGLRQVFSRPYIFEGYAPLGATVELLLNNRTVETQEVFPEENLSPGIGRYRFEEVELPGGILNEIVIVITEANGNEIRVEKSIIGTPLLLPKGRNAYLGVLGSKRDLGVQDNRNVEIGDFFGQIAGGRILYGLSDRLTIGGMLGFQQDYYRRYLEEDSHSDYRSYPKSSAHAGGLFSYLPFDKLLLSGEFAASQGEGIDSYNDMAFRIRGEYLPTQKLSLNTDFLHLGANYFDGQNPEICDRRGGELGMSWKLAKKWTVQGGIGQVRNNLDGKLDETLIADYQKIGLRTTAIPQTSMDFYLNRLGTNWQPDPKIMGGVKVRTSPLRDLDIFGQISTGDELDLGEHSDFFSGLKLKNAPWFANPSQSWGIRTSLTKSNALGLAYSDTGFEKIVSLIHDLNIQLKERPLRVRTEVLHNLSTEVENEKFRFRTSINYLLDSVGYNRLGITGVYRNGEYRVMANLGIRNLYASHKGRLTNVNKHRIRPAYGAVHGKVFLDYNGNILLDPEEPGVSDIKVCLGERRSTVTDENGYYILPRVQNLATSRVYLDMDTVPAIYTVTHGTQLVNIVRDSLTEVNLSLAPIISISGHIIVTEPDGQTTPISGARVYLNDAESNRFVADSFTAEDGSYYIGDIKSGDYILQIDEKTLPPNCQLSEQKRTIKVVSNKEDFQEIELPDFTADLIPE